MQQRAETRIEMLGCREGRPAVRWLVEVRVARTGQELPTLPHVAVMQAMEAFARKHGEKVALALCEEFGLGRGDNSHVVAAMGSETLTEFLGETTAEDCADDPQGSDG